jgi:EAL domain-containing protein (putative c-di-GMP-specific phosphodiesterase class I)
MTAEISILKRGNEEQLLVDHLQRMTSYTERGWAIHIHLSKLGTRTRNENLVFALDILRALVRQFSGRFFALRNGDIICTLRSDYLQQIRNDVRRVQLLFHDDPLFHLEQDGATKFCTYYNLTDNEVFSQFVGLARQLAAVTSPERRNAPSAQIIPLTGNGGVSAGPPAAPANDYFDLLGKLKSADISACVRQQPACVIDSEGSVFPMFDEVYVSILDLAKAMGADVHAVTDRWLFQHLTKLLDRRMLSLIARPDESANANEVALLRSRLLRGGNFSLNVNVANVLTPEFQALDNCIGETIRGTVVLEFQKIDAFADLGAYRYVRDHAHKLGYRICLDGVSHLSLPMVDRAELGLDFVKMAWTNDMPEDNQSLRKHVDRIGAKRIVLCRCDTPQAIDYGRQIGIDLFQGQHVDALLASRARAPSLLRPAASGPAVA